jgi:hypothetical protein
MLGRITSALIRREADAYLAQGLHEEALAVFRKSIDSGLQLPADVKVAIEQQIRQIEAEMVGTETVGHEELTDEQIAVIKEGWYGEASVDDLAVSAHALHAMGCHHNALEEFATLIQQGYSAHHIINPMAECLAHLNPPQDIVAAVDRLAAGLFQDPKNNFAFQLSLAEEMNKDRFSAHALALSLHLGGCSRIPSSYRVRLETLTKSSKSSSRQARQRARKKDLTSGASPASPSALHRIRAAVLSFAARMRSPKNGS